MKLKELISNAEEKKALAYKKYIEEESLMVGAMAYYMDITNAFLELIEELKKLDLPVVRGSLLALEKFKGGTHYSGTHNEFRTAFTGDWNDIESALTNND